MIFEPGKSYYVLTSKEYEELGSILPESLASLLQDFTLVDGQYYAMLSDINADELQFLEDEGFLNIFDYKKSTQSVHPF